jgi:hypothetical protein
LGLAKWDGVLDHLTGVVGELGKRGSSRKQLLG